MEPSVVFEDEFAQIVFGRNPVALGHLKVYPRQKVKSLDELPANIVAHLFGLATKCASLLFDGLQAQGTNIILNDGKNANQADETFCIDIIARAENDGLKFNWDFKQGDAEQVKQVSSEISSKIIIGEKSQAVPVKSAPIKVLDLAPSDDKDTDVEKLQQQTVQNSAPQKDIAPSQFNQAIASNQPVTARVVSENAAKSGSNGGTKDDAKITSNAKSKSSSDADKDFLFYEMLRLP